MARLPEPARVPVPQGRALSEAERNQADALIAPLRNRGHVPGGAPVWGDLDFFNRQGGETSAWHRLYSRLIQDVKDDREPRWQPAPDRIFRALEITPQADVRVVITAQDPYETEGRATGLAFETPPGIMSPSLQKMQSVMRAMPGLANTDFNFPSLARQGVLLLNSALTVRVDRPASHADLGWRLLITEIFRKLFAGGNVFFCLWGRHAHCIAVDAEFPLGAENLHLTGHPNAGGKPLLPFHGLPIHRFSRENPFLRPYDWLAARLANGLDQRGPIIWGTPPAPQAAPR